MVLTPIYVGRAEGTKSQGSQPVDPSLGVSTSEDALPEAGSWGLAGEGPAQPPSSVSSLLSLHQEWDGEGE